MRVDLDELMLYFDGELSATRAGRVARAVSRDEAAKAVVGEWTSVRYALRAWADAQSPLPTQLAHQIVRQIDARRAGAQRGHVARPQKGPKVWQRKSPGRVGRWPVLATACAVVAGLLLLQQGNDPRVSRYDARVKPVIAPGRDVVSTGGKEPASDPGGAALLALDSGGRQVAVFFVAADRGSMPVVWLLDDSPVRSERMQPL